MFLDRLKILSGFLILSASMAAHSQVAPAITGGGHPLPFRIGAGYSNYASDWSGRLGGESIWFDIDPPRLPRALSGFQLEVEGRDLNYHRTGDDPKLREYTFAGGINYAWRYDPAFHPYVKFMAGLGNLSFANLSPPGFPAYTHDSRTFFAPGGGIEVRAHNRIWIRGDYQYQFWPNFFHYHTMTPQGFTVGVFYDFSKYALRQYHE